MKHKLTLPMFFLAFFIVIACSLGAVSAANNINDVKIDDENTNIVHWDDYIQDSTILNTVIDTDYTEITESKPYSTSIVGSSIKNLFAHSQCTHFHTGSHGDGVGLRNSEVNNVVAESYDTYIITADNWCGGNFPNGIVEDSSVTNVVSNSHSTVICTAQNEREDLIGVKTTKCEILNTVDSSTNTTIFQGEIKTMDDSNITNTISDSQDTLIIQDDIHNSQITNTIVNSRNNRIYQGFETGYLTQPLTNCNLNNLTLFCENTTLNQWNLTGVNGVFIAIGCNNYTKTIENLTDTNFFNLTIGNLEIFNFHW
ncbi:MAG: hypothetical protein A4E27_00871 [Methanobacterium sp. PtaU1.Bin242]|nr:MAG: hypothetical protein A4E27_00871 [Methanobacterium sp. PtaU1.Bin242]